MINLPRIAKLLAVALAACVIAAPAASAETLQPSRGLPAALNSGLPAASTPGARLGHVGVRARAASPVSLLFRLLGRVVFRSRPVVSWPVRTYVRRVGVRWTKRQVIEWYCGQWDRYFGYDVSRWRWAADYYWSARWSWYFCSAHGY